MSTLLGQLPVVVAGLAPIGGLIYLWATRRRSPRAAGIASAGLVGVLVCQMVGSVGLPVLYERVESNGGLFGLPFRTTFVLINAAHIGLFWACLLLVVAAVAADRRPAQADE